MMPRPSANAVDRYWACDRWGRLFAGSALLGGLVISWHVDQSGRLLALLTAFIGLQLLIGACAGWCPFQQTLRRLGVKEREEIVATLAGGATDESGDVRP